MSKYTNLFSMTAQAWLTHKTFATKLAPRNYFILGRTGAQAGANIFVRHFAANDMACKALTSAYNKEKKG